MHIVPAQLPGPAHHDIFVLHGWCAGTSLSLRPTQPAGGVVSGAFVPDLHENLITFPLAVSLGILPPTTASQNGFYGTFKASVCLRTLGDRGLRRLAYWEPAQVEVWSPAAIAARDPGFDGFSFIIGKDQAQRHADRWHFVPLPGPNRWKLTAHQNTCIGHP